MAESNDNWEYIGKVNLFESNKRLESWSKLYVKHVEGRPFYCLKESRLCFDVYCWTVFKYVDNNRYNAFVEFEGCDEVFYRCYLNVPTWDKL